MWIVSRIVGHNNNVTNDQVYSKKSDGWTIADNYYLLAALSLQNQSLT